MAARHLSFDHSIARYVGIGPAVASVKVAVASAGTLAIFAYLSGLNGMPVRLAIIDGAIFGIYRISRRYLAEAGRNSRKLAKEKYSGGNESRQMQDIYEQCLE